MAIIKICSKSSKNIEEKLKYVADVNKGGVFGGYGISDNVEIAIKEMINTKLILDKTSRRMFVELIVSFNEYESSYLTVGKLEYIAIKICRILPLGYQVFYGIHINDETQKHIHFIINSVSCYSNDNKLDLYKEELVDLKAKVSFILLNIGLKPIISNNNRDFLSMYEEK